MPLLPLQTNERRRREIGGDPRATSPVPSKAAATLALPRGGRLQIGTVAAFKSESWPASSRNGGRHQIGKGGRLPLESAKSLDASLGSGATSRQPSSAQCGIIFRRSGRLYSHCRLRF